MKDDWPCGQARCSVIETIIVLVLLVLVLQLLFSFVPGLDSRVVSIIILLVVLAYFGRHGWRWR